MDTPHTRRRRPGDGPRLHRPTRRRAAAAGERVVADEAGMLDQDSALALFTVAAENGATLALIGDRAQLPAVGRDGVLDMAATLRGRTVDMSEVHPRRCGRSPRSRRSNGSRRPVRPGKPAARPPVCSPSANANSASPDRSTALPARAGRA
ncbi:AAA family ATPase [Propionicicella superfundia]|uniref:AAA family ATPase n=1 Tax=Propionicicella superfundia TaxID=348582 RepID=UPI003CCBADF7